MKLGLVAILLLVVTVAWSLVSVYSVWSQSQINDPIFAVWATKLSYEPSIYFVVTNSSPLESTLIEVIARAAPDLTDPTPEMVIYTQNRNQLSQLLYNYLGRVKYQDEYYAINFSDADTFGNPSKGILVWPPSAGLTVVGFIVLGAMWTSVGAIKWKKRAKQQHNKSN
jgi:hypothetical protein